MKKQISLIMLGILLIGMMSFLGNAHAITYNLTDYRTAIQKAADRVVALQSTTDYGWDWIVTGNTAHSANPSATNLYGVTTLGLLQAYNTLGAYAYREGAVKAEQFMIIDYPDIITDYYVNDFANYTNFYDGYNSTYNFGHSFDYKLLQQVARLIPLHLDDGNYAADSWWAQEALGGAKIDPTEVGIYNDGNQSTLFNYFVNNWIGPGSYGIAAWQASDFVLATAPMASGQGWDAWDANMADVINASIPNLLAESYAGPDVVNMGIAWALNALNFENGYNGMGYDISALQSTLLANQLGDGSWSATGDLNGDVQTTAYAVMALCSVGDYAQARLGAQWLMSQQLTIGNGAGGWLDSALDQTEYAEIDSEALQALIAAMYAFPVPDNLGINPPIAVNASLVLAGNTGRIVKIGDDARISVTVTNFGATVSSGTVTVSIYTVGNVLVTTLPPQPVSSLASGDSVVLAFDWDTTGMVQEAYNARAVCVCTETGHSTDDALTMTLVTTLPTTPSVSVNLEDPPTGSRVIGRDFYVDVLISGVDPLWDMAGFSVTMTYDSSKIVADNMIEGSFLTSTGSVTIQPPPLYTINNTIGSLTFGTSQDNTYPRYSVGTSGVLFTIKFTATNYGTSSLTLTNIELATWENDNLWGVPTSVLIPRTGTDGSVKVVHQIPGDINGDGTVDLGDLTALALAYGARTGSPNYNIYADINGDGVVNLVDLVTLASHYHEVAT